MHTKRTVREKVKERQAKFSLHVPFVVLYICAALSVMIIVVFGLRTCNGGLVFPASR